ncbi:hypothetical protein [Collimonas antrihumi]|uniref:hypothetical protein n=1 Tax=Collimonas antrihumi TaxID=1940615 RepID=UPI001B8CDD6C|nr:hypothetical protein [Collimonas antrihumi]
MAELPFDEPILSISFSCIMVGAGDFRYCHLVDLPSRYRPKFFWRCMDVANRHLRRKDRRRNNRRRVCFVDFLPWRFNVDFFAPLSQRVYEEMKTFPQFLVITLWLLLATSGLATWWIYHPETALSFSNPVWERARDIYGAKNADQDTDLAFLMSVICLCALTWFFLRLCRRLFAKK